MPLEIQGAHFLIRNGQLVRGTCLEEAPTGVMKMYTVAYFFTVHTVQLSHDLNRRPIARPNNTAGIIICRSSATSSWEGKYTRRYEYHRHDIIIITGKVHSL